MDEERREHGKLAAHHEERERVLQQAEEKIQKMGERVQRAIILVKIIEERLNMKRRGCL